MHSAENTPREKFLPTRRSLISRLRNSDDQESWRTFFDTYWRLIYGFAIKSGCTESEAEEVVQETIIALSRKMPQFKYDPAQCSFKGWLMHLARCRVVDEIRKRDHRLVGEQNGSAAHGTWIANLADPLGPELETIWKEEWEKNMIETAMQRVKRKANAQQYQIFHLHIVKKYSTEKIAEVLSISRGRVYLAKHRIAAMVKKELKLLERKLI